MSTELSSAISAIANILYTLVAICQVIVTFKIAKSIESSSKKTREVDIAKNLNEQWQRFNLLTATDENFRESWLKLGVEEDGDYSAEAIIFYIVNIFYDGWHAELNGQIESKFFEVMLKDHANFLLPISDRVINILKSNRGYDPRFVKMMGEKFQEAAKKKIKI
ncbi:hypothetical protein [Azospirillum agricola]|uniref:hypothetical protein n=1 Tax=Azospirillum agricola TaxID=1720247 RepID=UPI001178309D|nr:hypothetical protein [Azospirillum agricola]